MAKQSTATDSWVTALHAARNRYAARKAERQAEVQFYADQGYRPRYCIHGTNLWTDYDNICGGCEDGITLLNKVMAGLRADYEHFNKVLTYTAQAYAIYPPQEVRDALHEWVATTSAFLNDARQEVAR